MQSTINNSENYDASASISESNYEKNEHYTEFGLAKGEKKDSKARNYLAAKQSEEREKKIADHISKLPKKMQAKLAEETTTATATASAVSKPGKVKNTHITKIFYDRKNKASEAMILDDYAEQCSAEYDAHHELRKDKIDAMYADEEERQYQEYLEMKQTWDSYLGYGMSTWELMRLEYDIKAYETKMNGKLEEEVKTRTLLEYEEDQKKIFEAETWEADSHYNDYERAREEEDEGYKAGLALWLKYGLTKKQYDDNREYEANVKALNAFYKELDYQSHPDYEIRLKAAIKKFEDDFDAEQREQALKDEQNEWWKDIEDPDYEFDDREMETHEDWLERQQEERMQSLRENAIDDMRDDD
jgi:hypothetical protein